MRIAHHPASLLFFPAQRSCRCRFRFSPRPSLFQTPVHLQPCFSQGRTRLTTADYCGRIPPVCRTRRPLIYLDAISNRHSGHAPRPGLFIARLQETQLSSPSASLPSSANHSRASRLSSSRSAESSYMVRHDVAICSGMHEIVICSNASSMGGVFRPYVLYCMYTTNPTVHCYTAQSGVPMQGPSSIRLVQPGPSA